MYHSTYLLRLLAFRALSLVWACPVWLSNIHPVYTSIVYNVRWLLLRMHPFLHSEGMVVLVRVSGKEFETFALNGMCLIVLVYYQGLNHKTMC
jgi:hypothetical protein